MRQAWPLLLVCGCATAKVIGPPITATSDPNVPRIVVIEPFFETAAWQTEVKRVRDPFRPLGGSLTTEIKTTSLPLFAQVPSLATEHRAVLQAVQKLRPSWRVSSTSGLAALEGNVSVVRVVIEGNETVESS